MSYNFLVGHTGLYRAFYNLIITIMPFVMKRYGRISAILVFEFGGGTEAQALHKLTPVALDGADSVQRAYRGPRPIGAWLVGHPLKE
jgi:hypothetical protein